MVNSSPNGSTPDRRARGSSRARAEPPASALLGATNLNPFGDLHTLQHLSARFARSLRGVFEPLVRSEVRTWAEPLVVQRLADYRAERPETLTAWLPMAIAPAGGQALIVMDGRFTLELLDLFFGGTGHAPAELEPEFSPAAEAMIHRLGTMIAAPLAAAWEPVARLQFTPGRADANIPMPGDTDGDDAMIVTRFGLAHGTAKPVFIDIVYPVAALKPHGTALTGKVVAKAMEQDPTWQAALTRAAMAVKFPVRSVLAEPTISLARLMELKTGDVIPIHFTNDVPVMIGRDRIGVGTVGTSNGFAAIRITQLTRPDEGQY